MLRRFFAVVALAVAICISPLSPLDTAHAANCSTVPVSPQGARVTCGFSTTNPNQIRAYVGCTSWSWPGQVKYTYGFWAYSSSANGSWVQCPSGAVRYNYGYQGRNV